MTAETKRIKEAIKYMIGTGIAKTQQQLGGLIGYTNKSALSQAINKEDSRPDDFAERLAELCPSLNLMWIKTGEGEMLKSETIKPNPKEDDMRGNKWMEMLAEALEQNARLIGVIERMQGIDTARKNLRKSTTRLSRSKTK